jgi:hypothetical protein
VVDGKGIDLRNNAPRAWNWRFALLDYYTDPTGTWRIDFHSAVTLDSATSFVHFLLDRGTGYTAWFSPGVPIDSSDLTAGTDGMLVFQYVTYLGTTVLSGTMDAARRCVAGGQPGGQDLLRGTYSFTSTQPLVPSDYGSFEMTKVNGTV